MKVSKEQIIESLKGRLGNRTPNEVVSFLNMCPQFVEISEAEPLEPQAEGEETYISCTCNACQAGMKTGHTIFNRSDQSKAPNKIGKGLCDLYHPDDCCPNNPKCSFFEAPKEKHEHAYDAYGSCILCPVDLPEIEEVCKNHWKMSDIITVTNKLVRAINTLSKKK